MSNIFTSFPLNSKAITEVDTEIPRCCSISKKSEAVPFLILFDFTAPAICMAPPNNNSFSVRVVLPASGWAIMANVLRRLISSVVDNDIIKNKVAKVTERLDVWKIR